MSIEFRLPELGENITEAEVAEVLVKEGDQIEVDQAAMELETEKAVVELPCPHAGIVTKVHVAEGDTIKVGAIILTIDDSATAPAKTVSAEETSDDSTATAVAQAETPAVEPKRPAATAAVNSAPSTTSQQPAEPAREMAPKLDEQDDGPPPPAGPATRQMARRLGVDLRLVSGTGRSGRITQEDVEAHVRDRLSTTDSGGGIRTAPALPDFTQFGPVERRRLSKLNRTAADQLSTSWQVIPHVTQHELANITELETVRKRFMQTVGKGGPKVTVTAIVLKTCAQLLSEMPHVNSSLDAEAGELVLKQYYHIGVAVDTEHGLVVPVIRDADEKSILDIAEELTELAELARDRKLKLEQMQGATFTITNLGGIGGTSFTPIVNYPEVAILGLSRASRQPVLVDGELQERLMMPLSLSYDHRVINGADAARFVVRLSALLAQPFGLLANV